MREYQVRICGGLGVKFPGPTRHVRLIGRSRCGSALTQYVVGVCANRIGTERTRPTDALPGVPGAAGLRYSRRS